MSDICEVTKQIEKCPNCKSKNVRIIEVLCPSEDVHCMFTHHGLECQVCTQVHYMKETIEQ
ncbi:hypothetical protein LCGC14_1200810 [marine sediment metagenome]|uniref:Uncharacterized protein n=1 Tax=marine sediment metagenome TaxID=412755 RepID=A0A0F9NZA3_9ZZZZ